MPKQNWKKDRKVIRYSYYINGCSHLDDLEVLGLASLHQRIEYLVDGVVHRVLLAAAGRAELGNGLLARLIGNWKR